MGTAQTLAWPDDATRELAEKICRKVIDAKRHLFHHLPDVGEDDLFQEAALATLQAAHRYKRRYGAMSNYFYVVASRQILDVWRRRARLIPQDRAGGIAADAAENSTPAELPAENSTPPDAPADPLDALAAAAPAGDSDSLADWLAGVYDAARAAMPRPQVRRGRRWFSPAQVAAIEILRRRLRASTRGLQDILRERRDLREALHLHHSPSRQRISVGCRLIRDTILDVAKRAPSAEI